MQPSARPCGRSERVEQQQLEARQQEQVAASSIDLALVWGPLAGYFGAHSAVPLRLEAVPEDSVWPMSYDIAVGVRRDEQQPRQRLDAALATEQPAIDTLLRSYHIPHTSVTTSRAPP